MNKTKIQNILDLKSRGIVYAFLLLWVIFIGCNIFGVTSFNMGNFTSVLKEGSLVAIAGIGMTFPIITGRFDLSVASMIAFQGCVLMELVHNGGLNEILGIVLVLLLGAACGLFNGLLIAKMKIPAFIATLGMQYTYRALAYIISGSPIGLGNGSEEPIIFSLANKNFLGLPIPFWVMLLCLIAATFILRKTRLGRYTLAIGNSEGASEISGINIDKVILMVYTLTGVFTSICAIMMVSFLSQSKAGMVDGYEFKVITAVVLGGTALVGGKGSCVNTVIAALFVTSVTVGMNVFGISSYVQFIVQGALLIVAFSLNTVQEMINNAIVRSKAKKALKASMAASSQQK